MFWREKQIFATSAVPLLLQASVRIPVGTWPEAVFFLIVLVHSHWWCPICEWNANNAKIINMLFCV
jgi:hypothetical protein